MKAFILPLLFNLLSCFIEPPSTSLKVYNNKDTNITVIFKNTERGFKTYKVTTDITPKSFDHLYSHKGLHKSASKVYEYITIKDNNNTKLMDLRGEKLNNAVTIETDNKDHVIYRLDVY